MLDCKVNLKLWVKVKKDWRDSEFLMKNLDIGKKNKMSGIWGESNHKEKQFT